MIEQLYYKLPENARFYQNWKFLNANEANIPQNISTNRKNNENQMCNKTSKMHDKCYYYFNCLDFILDKLTQLSRFRVNIRYRRDWSGSS